MYSLKIRLFLYHPLSLKISKALYRIATNTDLPHWVREEALMVLIKREEVDILERIVSNTNLPHWVRETALEGLSAI
jgi:hypothetical protein